MTLARVKPINCESCSGAGERAPRRRSQDDVRLHLARVRDGEDADEVSSTELFRALWPSLLNYVSRLLQNRADAEDVAQTTLIKMFMQVKRYNGYSQPLSWARAIASFEVQVLRRAGTRRRQSDLSALEDVEDLELNAEQQLLREDRYGVLRSVLSTLSDADQKALLGESPELSIKSTTLRKRKQRAMARLRHLLAASSPDAQAS